jgi:hypothetical protein
MALLFPRPGELRLARWSEFDLANAVWTIPASRAAYTLFTDAMKQRVGVCGWNTLIDPPIVPAEPACRFRAATPG